ncbi:3680_t:CDS:2 [Ambispora gerdemannii]|uniref:3680_t:CDS:1 n=1 Tax=Ambispora gerdemannii TaxID=144530 RepID=A0A9N9ASC9_9GLOM|nr:3680_t:CDS:2 [Ambispora gerdemannii]
MNENEEGCRVHVKSPKRGDRYAPGDEMLVQWELIGKECRVNVNNIAEVPLHKVDAFLFANLTITKKTPNTSENNLNTNNNSLDMDNDTNWQWNYRTTLYHNTSTKITSFKYPIQIILSPNIRNSSLFFVDIELGFLSKKSSSIKTIWDYVGPFTIVPIPPPSQQEDNNTIADALANGSGGGSNNNGDQKNGGMEEQNHKGQSMASTAALSLIDDNMFGSVACSFVLWGIFSFLFNSKIYL